MVDSSNNITDIIADNNHDEVKITTVKLKPKKNTSASIGKNSGIINSRKEEQKPIKKSHKKH